MEGNNESKVRDISLWEYGRKEIEIAEVEMPGIITLIFTKFK